MQRNDYSTVPWSESRAKEMLKAEIMSGDVTESSNYEQVYYSNSEYQKYPKKNFRTNMKNLISSIKKKEARALFDLNAVTNDKMLYPRPQLTSRGYPYWDTSDASRYLKWDIDNDVHNSMKMCDFYRSRPSYLLFPEKVFRNHVYQEVTSRLQTSYWLKKKGKK